MKPVSQLCDFSVTVTKEYGMALNGECEGYMIVNLTCMKNVSV